MRQLLGIVILLGIMHIVVVEVLAVNVIGNCTTQQPEDQALCACMKNTLRLGYEPEKSLLTGKPVILDTAFQVCRSPENRSGPNG